jgi:hypothetical protein
VTGFGRWLLDEDGPFAGALSVWSALGFVLTAAALSAPPHVVQAEDVPVVAWQRVAVRVTPPPPTVAPAPAASPSRQAPGPSAPAAAASTPRRDPAESRLLRRFLLGTRGEGRDLRTELFDGAPGATAADLQAADAAVDHGSGRRGPGRGGDGPARIGEPGLVGGGDVTVRAPRLQVEPPVWEGPATTAGTAPARLRAQAGQLRACYERELKLHPELEGRMEIALSIADGAVTGHPAVTVDTVGSEALATCVERRVGRFTFEPGTTGQVTLPVVFTRP